MALIAVKIATLAGLAALTLGVYPDRVRGALIAVGTCVVAAFVLHFVAPWCVTGSVGTDFSCPGRVHRLKSPALTTAGFLGPLFQIDPLAPLDSWEQKRNIVLLMFQVREAEMLKVFVEEAAALASLAMFIGMIAVWAQLITQI
jgi:hypothetical protein